MALIDIGKAPGNKSVLPFYGTGAFFFLILCILLFFSADDLFSFYFTPHLLAAVHTAALGWGTMIIFGAAYQLLPVICERDLFSEKLAFLSYCFLTLGAMLLIGCFWEFHTGAVMITGGGLIFIAVFLFFVNVLKTTKIGSSYSVQKAFVFSSAMWLLITVSIGLLLVINLSHPFFSHNHLEILKLHAHAGLAGWFLQLITGISAKLVPMFLLGKSQKQKLLSWSLFFQNSGLILFLVDGYLEGASLRYLIYATWVIVGILLWLIYLYDVFKHRIKKKIDYPMRHTIVSFVSLIIGLILVPVVYYSVAYFWAILYGIFLFLGWITSIILGMTFKTLPFIVWNSHYKELNGKVRVPLPRHLFNDTLLKYQFWIFLAALYILALSVLFHQMIALRIALFLWIAVACIYCWNITKVLIHKTTVLNGNSD